MSKSANMYVMVMAIAVMATSAALAGVVNVPNGDFEAETGTTITSWTETVGDARSFATGTGTGNIVIHQDEQNTAFTVLNDLGTAIAASKNYLIAYEYGQAGNGSGGKWTVEFGTLNGGTFTALASNVTTSASTIRWSVGNEETTYFQYTSGLSVSGDNLAIRASVDGVEGWMGYDDFEVTISPVVNVPNGDFESETGTTITSWTETVGDARSFASGTGTGNIVIHQDEQNTAFTVLNDLGTAIAASKNYFIVYEYGQAGGGSGGKWTVEFGTLNGGTFTALASNVTISASTIRWTEGTEETTSFQYTSGSSVSGDNLAIRASVDGVAAWMGYDDFEVAILEPKKVVNVDVQPTGGATYCGRAAAPDAVANAIWNALEGATADDPISIDNLVASDGTATIIDVKLSGHSSGGLHAIGTDANELTKDAVLVDNGSTANFKISRLVANTSYDIYLYTEFLVAGWGDTIYVIGTTTNTASSLSSAPTVANGTGWTEGDQYVKFTVDSGDRGEISGTYKKKSNRYGVISGIQIMPTPSTEVAVVNVDVQPAGATAYTGLAAAPDLAGNTLWNILEGPAVTDPLTITNLFESDGSATTIGVTLSGHAEGPYALGTDANTLTKDAVLVDGNVPRTANFMINGLSADTSYDIYLYTEYYLVAGWGDTIYVIGTTTNTASSLSSAPTVANGTGWTEGDQYVKFTVDSNGSGEISGTYKKKSSRYGVISGIQIMPTPPPQGTIIVIK